MDQLQWQSVRRMDNSFAVYLRLDTMQHGWGSAWSRRRHLDVDDVNLPIGAGGRSHLLRQQREKGQDGCLCQFMILHDDLRNLHQQCLQLAKLPSMYLDIAIALTLIVQCAHM